MDTPPKSPESDLIDFFRGKGAACLSLDEHQNLSLTVFSDQQIESAMATIEASSSTHQETPPP